MTALTKGEPALVAGGTIGPTVWGRPQPGPHDRWWDPYGDGTVGGDGGSGEQPPPPTAQGFTEPLEEAVVTAIRPTPEVNNPFEALAWYIFGNGEPVSGNIAELDLERNPYDITQVILAFQQRPGTYAINETVGRQANGHNAELYGRFSLNFQGQVTIDANGQYRIEGQFTVLRGRYDANTDPSRGSFAGSATQVLGAIPSTPYDIIIGESEPYVQEGQAWSPY